MSGERSLLISLAAVVIVGATAVYIVKRPAPQIRFYDKNLTRQKLSCLALRIHPPYKPFEKLLRETYAFDDRCAYRMTLRFKSDIVCNSVYNASQKCVEGMPHAFLRFDIRRGFHTLYSYYSDVEGSVDKDTIINGWRRVRKDVLKP